MAHTNIFHFDSPLMHEDVSDSTPCEILFVIEGYRVSHHRERPICETCIWGRISKNETVELNITSHDKESEPRLQRRLSVKGLICYARNCTMARDGMFFIDMPTVGNANRYIIFMSFDYNYFKSGTLNILHCLLCLFSPNTSVIMI